MKGASQNFFITVAVSHQVTNIASTVQEAVNKRFLDNVGIKRVHHQLLTKHLFTEMDNDLKMTAISVSAHIQNGRITEVLSK